jgi:oligopeptide/dipeptide ABC transporter ATP-binding protein
LATEDVLDVENMSVEYTTGKKMVQALKKVSLRMHKGKILGVVGESGSGKSTLGLAIMGLLPSNGKVSAGKITFRGGNVLSPDQSRLESIRGTGVSMIFQEPLSSLNPVYRVGYQIAEAIKARELRQEASATSTEDYSNLNQRLFDYRSIENYSRWKKFSSLFMRINISSDIRKEILDLLRAVRITDAANVIDKYPHELSGGMRQRVMIAMALAQRPDVLIADEPTTALDVTTQAKVLALIKGLTKEYGTAVMLISHDLAVVSEVADYVQVMYLGEVMEYSPSLKIFNNPLHPYTVGLLGSILGTYVDEQQLEPILGSVPDPANPPSGCTFHTRCPKAFEKCKRIHPSPTAIETSIVFCHLFGEETRSGS